MTGRPRALLRALLAELRYQGIRELAGDILLDRTLFRPARTDIDKPPFDQAPESAYNVIPDAPHLSGSLMDLEISSLSGQVSARLLPPLPGIEIDAGAMQPSERACKDWGADWLSPAPLTLRPHPAARAAWPGTWPGPGVSCCDP